MSAHTPGRAVPWNAGTGKGWVDQRGYRWIRVNGRSVREHRHIMAEHRAADIARALLARIQGEK